MAGQFIFGRRQLGMPGQGTILTVVDIRLQMFDAYTEGKGFGFDQNGLADKPGHCCSGTVPNGQHQLARRQLMGYHPPIRQFLFDFDTAETAVTQLQTGQPATEAEFAAQADDLFSNMLNTLRR
jgi:hypothetical protein